MIDIHNHIIYGVDDGSRSFDESMKMVELFMKNGFKEIIATSHYDPSRYMVKKEDILEKSSILNDEIKKRNLDFKIHPGHEIHVEPNTLDKIHKKELLTLDNSRYVLLELSFVNKPLFLKDLIYNLSLEGYIPIIAHVERYPYVEKNISYLYEFIKMGALIQINYSSMKSHHHTTKKLLEKNMVHFIGTDSHQSEWRSPNIEDEKNEIIEIIGREKFEKLTQINPQKIINDEFIPSGYDEIVREEEQVKNKSKKKGLFNFWRKKWR